MSTDAASAYCKAAHRFPVFDDNLPVAEATKERPHSVNGRNDRSWGGYDRARDAINARIKDVETVTVVDYTRETSLKSIPTNKAYPEGNQSVLSVRKMSEIGGKDAIAGDRLADNRQDVNRDRSALIFPLVRGLV
ncbi:hypothetical protein [Mesorhizobium sp.]|uniref:hypothetical protein n=1 Tax=Mesorhizobium sp. TaxID=1871066 RepID=UPI002580E2E6|nr:hypothetical protein [Mesorhizobium sp.]